MPRLGMVGTIEILFSSACATLVAVSHDLYPDEAKQQKEETDQNEHNQCRNPVAELVELAFAIVQTRHESEPSRQP